jgi:hypothetical protein
LIATTSSGVIDTGLLQSASLTITLSLAGQAYVTPAGTTYATATVIGVDGAAPIALSSSVRAGVVGAHASMTSAANGASLIAMHGDQAIAHLLGNGNVIEGVLDGVHHYQGLRIEGFNSTDYIATSNGSSPPATQAMLLIDVGVVGTGSKQELADAANHNYHVVHSLGERVLFMGTDNGGNAVLGYWSGGDTNANSLVDANEFSADLVLVGVSTSTLGASNFRALDFH